MGVTQDFLNVVYTENAWPGGNIALMTCGDDCPGMNAAIRAVMSGCNHLSCNVTYIKCGFYGLVHGGEYFVPGNIRDTLDIVSSGGTMLKSLKCPEFLERPARLKAAQNLVEKGLSYIMLMGGDGSMSAMKVLWEEWASLLKEMDDKELVARDLLRTHRLLKVGIISASVTNDVCGTDMCIGANTALHRILEVVDSIRTTAISTGVAYVVEVMGEKCGYLALACGVAANVTMVFIPEWPAQGNWQDELVHKIKEERFNEVEAILILVSAGAIDKNGNPITSNDIRDVLVQRQGLETVVSILGPVQKGGTPSAYDRLLAARLSVEAVMAMHYRDETDDPYVMGIVGNEVTCLPLVDVVRRNGEILASLQTRDFATAVKLRGRKFQDLLSSYRTLQHLQPSPLLRMNAFADVRSILIIRVGRYSVGQCLATKTIVSYCASKDIAVYVSVKGFEGLAAPMNVVRLNWDKVSRWDSKTSNCFGSSRVRPSDIGLDVTAQAFQELKISGVALLGSFHAFESLYQMQQVQSKYRPLSIPMCFLPVTVLNNIPGSEMTIGCDSALNENVTYCDKVKRMARSMDASVIVVETMGHNCGYLTTAAAVCAAADTSYIPNEPFNVDTLLQDVEVIKSKIMEYGMQIGLVLHSENASWNYNSQFTYQLFREEGKNVFQCRHETIGHVQMGAEPSPLDRISATTHGLKCGEWLVEKVQDSVLPDGTVYCVETGCKSVLCETKNVSMKPITRLAAEANFDECLPTYLWWSKLRKLARILSKLPTDFYEMEMVDENFGDDDSTSVSDRSTK